MYPPQQPARRRKKPNKVLLAVLLSVLGVLALCLVVTVVYGVTHDDKKTGSPAAKTNSPAAKPPAAYNVVKQEKGTITVVVDYLPTKDQMTAIVTDLQAKQSKDDGYFVLINCSTGGTKSSDNRLGNGKFAIGNIGEARTGLKEGVIEVQVNEGRTCPAA